MVKLIGCWQDVLRMQAFLILKSPIGISISYIGILKLSSNRVCSSSRMHDASANLRTKFERAI